MQKEVIESWGEAPGKVMVAGERIVIPGLEMGNIFLGIQPARPPLGEADLTSASHDKTKPPHHQYLAFYHWLGGGLIFVGLLLRWFSTQSSRTFRTIRERSAQVIVHFVETMTGIKAVQSYRREQRNQELYGAGG